MRIAAAKRRAAAFVLANAATWFAASFVYEAPSAAQTASAASESLFVTSSADGTVTRFDLNTLQSTVIATLPGTAEGLACSPDGRLTITLSGFHAGPRQLVSLAHDGRDVQVLLDFASTPELQNSGGPEGPSYDTNGVLYFNTRPSQGFPHTGTWKFLGPGTAPVQIIAPFAFGSCPATVSAEATGFLTAGPFAGHLIAADQCNNRVIRSAPPFDSVQPAIDFLRVPSPNGLAVNVAGNIYVADLSSQAIHRFAPDGTSLGTFAFIGPGLLKLAFDSKGNLYAARGGVVRVAPDGTKTEFGNIAEANGVAVCSPRFLSFPLRNKTAFTAKITSVFDHSMSETYCPDGVVTAYTGEEGRREFGSDFVDRFKQCDAERGRDALYGFMQATREPFSVGGQYAAGGNPSFLYYDGHPGYDYRTTDQAPNGTLCREATPCNHSGSTQVLAAAAGTVVCVRRGEAPVEGCGEGPGEVKIDHGNSYFTIYLHLSRIDVTPGRNVTEGDLIGTSGAVAARGNPHLHFEVRRNIGGVLVPIDPYGWTGPGRDPYSGGVSINLWK